MAQYGEWGENAIGLFLTFRVGNGEADRVDIGVTTDTSVTHRVIVCATGRVPARLE